MTSKELAELKEGRLHPPLRDLPYAEDTIFLIKGVVYVIESRLDVWNVEEEKDDYIYTMKAEGGVKCWEISHVHLYNTKKQMETRDAKSWKRKWTRLT